MNISTDIPYKVYLHMDYDGPKTKSALLKVIQAYDETLEPQQISQISGHLEIMQRDRLICEIANEELYIINEIKKSKIPQHGDYWNYKIGQLDYTISGYEDYKNLYSNRNGKIRWVETHETRFMIENDHFILRSTARDCIKDEYYRVKNMIKSNKTFRGFTGLGHLGKINEIGRWRITHHSLFESGFQAKALGIRNVG